MLGTSQREEVAASTSPADLRLNGVDNQAQLHATINAAIRAGVSFWPIDARGLVAEAPLGDATHGSPGGIGMYTGASAMALATNFQRSQDTLYALAADTGGKALLDNNDLSHGNRAGAEGHFQLLHHRLLHHQYRAGRQVPQDQDLAERRLTAKLDYRAGLLRRQAVQQVHHRRQGTAARRCADAGRSDYGADHRHGGRITSS